MNDIQKVTEWSEYVLKCLQELTKALIEANIVPTIEKLQSLYYGSSLLDLINESCENQKITRYPKRLQEIIFRDTTKEIENIRSLANGIINDPENIEWNFYSVSRNGKVIISENYKDRIRSRFDDGAKILLDAYELFNNVKEQRIGKIMREQNKSYIQAKEEVERILAVSLIPNISLKP